jgi:hypothetical protein
MHIDDYHLYEIKYYLNYGFVTVHSSKLLVWQYLLCNKDTIKTYTQSLEKLL